MANLERIYTIPLAKAFEYIRTKRARRAIKLIRHFALRHMKAEEAKISEGVNSLVFRDGMQKPPRRVKVRIVKGEDAVAKVWLIGEEEKMKEISEKKKKDEEKKQADKKSAEAKKEEAKKAAAGQKKEAAKPAVAPAKPAALSAQATAPKPEAAAPAKPAAPPAQAAASPAKK